MIHANIDAYVTVCKHRSYAFAISKVQISNIFLSQELITDKSLYYTVIIVQ